MKKTLFAVLLAVSFSSFAGEAMGVYQKLTNYLVVTNDHFSCTFFPRHLFPVWFKTPDGREFPEIIRFRDRARIGNAVYWLYTDMWVEHKVLKNTADEFVIRCTGVYCHIHGDKVAPGDLRAVYTYTIRRDSPTMKVTAEITRSDTAPLRIYFLEPAWSMKLDFDRILCDGREIHPEPGKVFDRVGKVTCIKNGLAVTVNFNRSAPIAAMRCKMRDGFSSALTYNRMMKGKKIRLTGFITFRDKASGR